MDLFFIADFIYQTLAEKCDLAETTAVIVINKNEKKFIFFVQRFFQEDNRFEIFDVETRLYGSYLANTCLNFTRWDGFCRKIHMI